MAKRYKRHKELSFKQKGMCTLGLLILCRLACSIPTPGVNAEYFKEMIAGNSSLNFFNALSGNGLSNLSIMTLSITPYITASIIIQLLAVCIPKLAEIQTGGTRDDRKKMEKITVITGAVLAFLQGIAMAAGFGSRGLLINYKWYYVLLVAIFWTIGATILSIVGKIITDKFVGNGISLILFCNIVASYPSDLKSLYEAVISGNRMPVMILRGCIAAAVLIAMFVFVVVINLAEKRIRVQYSNKMGRALIGNSSDIPIKLCPGSVVPVIFASSIISMPVLIAQAFNKSNVVIDTLNTSNWFNGKPYHTLGCVFYIALIFAFSYFYTEITFNPMKVADDIKKNGGMITGIRPGKSTEMYLRNQMKYTIALGAIALSIISVIPFIISGVFGLSKLSFMGTSIIITVGVVIETSKLLSINKKSESYATKSILGL